MRSGEAEEIRKLFTTLTAQSRQIIKSIIELAYFMRGSISYHECLLLSPFERAEMSDFINKRLEAEAKKTFPVY